MNRASFVNKKSLSLSIFSWINPWLFIEKSIVIFTLSVHNFIYVSNLIMFSTKRWRSLRFSGFTIREVLVVVVVISVGLLSVVVVLTNGMKYVQKTRQKVIAINLAREWMEAVYQIRDTNRTRWAWVKDQCRLKINPLVNDQSSDSCNDDLRFTSWSYVLQRLMTGDQTYFALTGVLLSWIDFSDGIDSSDYAFSLCQQSGYWDSCIWNQTTTSEWKYFREIQWLWLYLKDVSVTWWAAIVCTWGLDRICWWDRAKEFRFCSKVAYIGDGTGEVKICGVITNFKK